MLLFNGLRNHIYDYKDVKANGGAPCIRKSSPIRITIGNEGVKRCRFELETKVDGPFNITKNEFNSLLVEINWSMDVLTNGVESISNV